MSIIFEKLKNNLDLNKEEQKILEKEYTTAKWKIYSTRFSIIFFLLLQLAFVAVVVAKFSKNGNSFLPPSGDRISVLPLDKPIEDVYADDYIRKIEKLYSDKNVKAIVVSLRSPGGTPSASWKIADVVSKLQKDNKKPVYTYVDSAAVSGSYMIASQSNTIYANPFSIVGSIGVIIDHLVFDGVSKKIGFEEETLTTGEFKKPLSTFSKLTERQRNYLQDNLLGVAYEGFIQVVAKGRHRTVEEIRKFADGKVFVAMDKRVDGILVDKVVNWSEFKNIVYNDIKVDKNKIKFIVDPVTFKEKGLFNLFGQTSFNIAPEFSNNLTNSIK